tara:strand:- start:68 stop:1522 length:1455 start_codon:yes stop_codon:yes gene_type:complete
MSVRSSRKTVTFQAPCVTRVAAALPMLALSAHTGAGPDDDPADLFDDPGPSVSQQPSAPTTPQLSRQGSRDSRDSRDSFTTVADKTPEQEDAAEQGRRLKGFLTAEIERVELMKRLQNGSSGRRSEGGSSPSTPSWLATPVVPPSIGPLTGGSANLPDITTDASRPVTVYDVVYQNMKVVFKFKESPARQATEQDPRPNAAVGYALEYPGYALIVQSVDYHADMRDSSGLERRWTIYARPLNHEEDEFNTRAYRLIEDRFDNRIQDYETRLREMQRIIDGCTAAEDVETVFEDVEVEQIFDEFRRLPAEARGTWIGDVDPRDSETVPTSPTLPNLVISLDENNPSVMNETQLYAQLQDGGLFMWFPEVTGNGEEGHAPQDGDLTATLGVSSLFPDYFFYVKQRGLDYLVFAELQTSDNMRAFITNALYAQYLREEAAEAPDLPSEDEEDEEDDGAPAPAPAPPAEKETARDEMMALLGAGPSRR